MINILSCFVHILNQKMRQDLLLTSFLELHSEVNWRDSPIVVELGVDKGQSTKVFLNAIYDKPNAKLVSVDIRNCSEAVNSKVWEFVQQDSSDIQKFAN